MPDRPDPLDQPITLRELAAFLGLLPVPERGAEAQAEAGTEAPAEEAGGDWISTKEMDIDRLRSVINEGGKEVWRWPAAQVIAKMKRERR